MADVKNVSDMGAKRVLSVDIGGTKIAAAMVLFPADGSAPSAGPVRSVPTEAARGGEAVYGSVETLVREMLAVSNAAVAGIGIGSAGVVNHRIGSIVYANEIMPGWGGVELGPRLRVAMGLPVEVMGDVHAHALGEARWGAGRGYSSVLCLGIGTGIGGALVEGGSVMRGAHGGAGHMGHVICLEAIGMPCACGRVSHLESVASGTSIGAAFERAYGRLDPSRPVAGRDVSELVTAGDTRASGIVEEAGYALGECLGSLANVLDPAIILLSGGVVHAGISWSSDVWRAAVMRGYRLQALDPMLDTPIDIAALGDKAPLVGAAQNLLDALSVRT